MFSSLEYDVECLYNDLQCFYALNDIERLYNDLQCFMLSNVSKACPYIYIYVFGYHRQVEGEQEHR